MRVPVHLTCLQRPLDGQPLHAFFTSRWRSSRRLVSAVSTWSWDFALKCFEIISFNVLFMSLSRCAASWTSWHRKDSFAPTFQRSGVIWALLGSHSQYKFTICWWDWAEADAVGKFSQWPASLASRLLFWRDRNTRKEANSAGLRVPDVAPKYIALICIQYMYYIYVYIFDYICIDKLKISLGQQKTKTSLLSYVSFTTGIVAAMLQSMRCSCCSWREKRNETRVQSFLGRCFQCESRACLFSHSSSSFRQVICIDATSS